MTLPSFEDLMSANRANLSAPLRFFWRLQILGPVAVKIFEGGASRLVRVGFCIKDSFEAHSARGAGRLPHRMMAEDMMTEMNRNRTTSSLSRGLTADMDDIDDALSRQLRPRAAARRRARLAGSALIVLALCAGSLAVVLFREQLLKMAIWIKALPPEQGGAAYTVLVALWLVALLPTSLLEIAGGFMFGFWLAALCSTLGKCLGSFISFAIGRRYKDWVREKLLDEPKTLHRGEPGYVAGLELAMRLNPFSTCLALRLAYVPEAVQNYVGPESSSLTAQTYCVSAGSRRARCALRSLCFGYHAGQFRLRHVMGQARQRARRRTRYFKGWLDT